MNIQKMRNPLQSWQSFHINALALHWKKQNCPVSGSGAQGGCSARSWHSSWATNGGRPWSSLTPKWPPSQEQLGAGRWWWRSLSSPNQLTLEPTGPWVSSVWISVWVRLRWSRQQRVSSELEPLAAPPGLLALNSPRILRPGVQAESQRLAYVRVTLKRGQRSTSVSAGSSNSAPTRPRAPRAQALHFSASLPALGGWMGAQLPAPGWVSRAHASRGCLTYRQPQPHLPVPSGLRLAQGGPGATPGRNPRTQVGDWCRAAELCAPKTLRELAGPLNLRQTQMIKTKWTKK